MSYQMTELVRSLTTAPSGAVLHPSQKLVLVLLATYYNNDDGAAFPGLSRIANESGVHRNSVMRILNDLEAHGCIARERRESAWGNNAISTRYVFLPEFLESPACREQLPGSRVRRPKGSNADGATPDQPESVSETVSDSEVATPTVLPSNAQEATVASPMVPGSHRNGGVALPTLLRSLPGSALNGTEAELQETEPKRKKKPQVSSEPAAAFFINQPEEVLEKPKRPLSSDLLLGMWLDVVGDPPPEPDVFKELKSLGGKVGTVLRLIRLEGTDRTPDLIAAARAADETAWEAMKSRSMAEVAS